MDCSDVENCPVVVSFVSCGSVMDWGPLHGVLHLLPNGSWERLQPPFLISERKYPNSIFSTNYSSAKSTVTSARFIFHH